MEPFGFEKLPEIIRQLFEKVERIEEMVSDLNPVDDTSNDLLTVKEAADYLKVSLQSLYSKVCLTTVSQIRSTVILLLISSFFDASAASRQEFRRLKHQ
ncbi:hypothetical protein ACUN24_16275 [Pedobacter sp. WC2501]|uniref:hypothetical protein n=1 Tax=Pedobacter sp. WC2501 TaxID=3461400 RepID=UPI00404533A3